MYEDNQRYLLEFRIKGQVDWTEGSSFRSIQDAKRCIDATLNNVQTVQEGRVFDRKLLAFRYYRSAFPFKS